jgi:hypothetical protein
MTVLFVVAWGHRTQDWLKDWIIMLRRTCNLGKNEKSATLFWFEAYFSYIIYNMLGLGFILLCVRPYLHT